MKKIVSTLLLVLAASVAAAAQTPGGAAREGLSSLPESQAVLYVNARRITNDALPRVLPVAQLDKFFGDLQKQVNVDLRAVEYVVLGVRYGDSLATGAVPDFGVAVRGGFSADALLSLARMAQPGQYRPETHAGKTLDIYKMDFGGAGGSPNAAKPPPVKLPSEIALVSFGADELMVGTPAYLRAALDARSAGAGRLRADLVDLALRNPDTLLSLAGDLPPGLSTHIEAAMGAAPTGGGAHAGMMNEIKRLAASLRQLRMSVNMTATDFGVETTMRTERAEDARALSGLVKMGVGMGEQEISKDLGAGKTAQKRADAQKALAVLKSLTNETRDNEVTLGISAAQSTVAELVKGMTAKPAPKTAAPAATTRRGARRAPARRRP